MSKSQVSIMKVGTMSSIAYFIRRDRKDAGTELSVGQKLSFREQAHGSKWQRGTIDRMAGDMPCLYLD